MEATTTLESLESLVLEKTRELCNMILESGDYRDSRSKIEAFFSDEKAQSEYRTFSALGERLQYKQQTGRLTQDDIDGYDDAHASLRENPVTAGFFDAEDALNSLVTKVSKFVGKTVELGRIPELDELTSGGCCGGGCGCSH